MNRIDFIGYFHICIYRIVSRVQEQTSLTLVRLTQFMKDLLATTKTECSQVNHHKLGFQYE